MARRERRAMAMECGGLTPLSTAGPDPPSPALRGHLSPSSANSSSPLIRGAFSSRWLDAQFRGRWLAAWRLITLRRWRRTVATGGGVTRRQADAWKAASGRRTPHAYHPKRRNRRPSDDGRSFFRIGNLLHRRYTNKPASKLLKQNKILLFF